MWCVCSGRNGQNWIANFSTHSKRDALNFAFQCVKNGYDWVEVWLHEEGDF